jgi:hypothetical protein
MSQQINQSQVKNLVTDLAAKEAVSNKSNTTTLGTSTTAYPTQNAVKVYVDTAIAAQATKPFFGNNQSTF